ncbi:hypothetical protein H8E77_25775 [bacterium]|nr:hypothetical protein [bacterium]
MRKGWIGCFLLLLLALGCASKEKLSVTSGQLTIRPTAADIAAFQKSYQKRGKETVALLPIIDQEKRLSNFEKLCAQVLESVGSFRVLLLSNISINQKNLMRSKTAQIELEKIRLAVTSQHPPKYLFFVTDIDSKMAERRFLDKASYESSLKDEREKAIIFVARFRMLDVQTGEVVFEESSRTQLGASDISSGNLNNAAIEKTLNSLREKLQSEFPIEGTITEILAGNHVRIDLGRENGVAMGTLVRVIRRSKVVGIPFEIGKLKVTQPGAYNSIAQVMGLTYPEQPVQLGDTVTLMK